jgi:hypothetical protein
MGEYAEMMLDGTCCEGCGEFMGNPIGYPRYCSKACEPADYRAVAVPIVRRRLKPHQRAEIARHVAKAHVCQCGKRFKYSTALEQHQRDKHSAEKDA